MSRIGLSATDQTDGRVVLNSEVRRVRCYTVHPEQLVLGRSVA